MNPGKTDTNPEVLLPGQFVELAIPGLEPPATEAKTTPDRAAFGRFLKPEQYDVFGDYDISTLTEAEKAWLTPANLASNLFGRPSEAKSVVNRIALNGYEYKLVSRSPKKLAETAVTNTLASDDVNQDLLDRSERSGRHALEGKLVRMNEHAEAMRARRDSVRELKRRAEMPGRAHKSDAYMRQLFNDAFTEFKTILEAVHIQRRWSDEQRHKVEASLLNYLTQGDQRTRTQHWKKMLDLAVNYLDIRIGLFTRKSQESQVLIDKMLEDETKQSS